MARVNTVLPADSVEFCPLSTSTQIFVVGTYQLEELPNIPHNQPDSEASLSGARPRRWGECLVFQADEDSDQCSQLQAVAMPAVLDMKWWISVLSLLPIYRVLYGNRASDLLAIADAEGNIVLHRWQEQLGRLDHVQTLGCHADLTNLICLSLDWAKHRCEESSSRISASLSDGSVLIAHQSDAGMTVTDMWHAHDFEPWITAWDRWDDNLLYTGGDDCILKGWDIRTGFSRPAFANKRFDAGVTTIQSSPHLEHTLAVGSYDSTVRLFDTRQPLQVVTQANVGGGAWRVKWHPEASRKQHLLVACMHDGFKVVNFESSVLAAPNASSDWNVLTRFDKHESLAYGVDWSHASATKEGTLVASCSFYDHSLHLWRT